MNAEIILTMMLVVGLCLALDRAMNGSDCCPHCGGQKGWHWPNCERVKK